MRVKGRCAEEDRRESDLGCYTEEGPAAVAHDLMIIKMRWRTGERRLPQIEDGVLLKPISSYVKIMRSFLSEMDKTSDALAVELKSKGLAERLHYLMTGPRPPTAAVLPPAGSSKRPVDPEVAEEPEKRQKSEIEAVPMKTVEPHREDSENPKAATIEKAIPEKKTEKQNKNTPKKVVEPSKVPKEAKKASQKSSKEPATKAKALSKAKSAAVEESDAPIDKSTIPRVWLKDEPEYPRGSGKYPLYVKPGPLKTGYFTLAVKMVKQVLPNMQHGDITMISVEDPEKSWPATYLIKEEANREPGNVSVAALLSSWGLGVNFFCAPSLGY